MFPEPVRNITSAVTSLSFAATKSIYNVGRSGLWIAASSAIILALPVLFEMERSQMEEQQMMQQRQVSEISMGHLKPIHKDSWWQWKIQYE